MMIFLYINSKSRLYILFIDDHRRGSIVTVINVIDMSLFYCNQCERSFKWKVSFKRHQERRKTPCRKPMYSCGDCSKDFTSHQSLGKHKNLYCKFRMQQPTLQLSSSPFLAQSTATTATISRTTMPKLVKEEAPVADSSSRTLSSIIDALYRRDSNECPSTTAAPAASTSMSTSINDLLDQLMNGNLSPPRFSLPSWFDDDQQQHQQKQQECQNQISAADKCRYVPSPLIEQKVVPSVTESIVHPPVLINNQYDQTAAADSSIPIDDAACNDISGLLHCFDEMLVAWMDEILRLEGKVRSNAIVKGEVAKVINRMLQDGLISDYEHESLSHTNKLFIRLHDLIYMKTFSLNRKREIVDILADLFEMHRITKSVFVELCINI